MTRRTGKRTAARSGRGGRWGGWILAGWLAAAGPAAAEPGPVRPEVDRLLARWDRADAPGAAVGVAEGGRIVHARGYGRANLEHGVSLTAETVAESGSVAKQFTAAAVALLAERGRLRLEDPVRRHVPELDEALGAVTLGQVLSHTGGVRDIHGLFDLLGRPSYRAPHDNAEAVRVLARQRRLNFAPGAEYSYSNGGYILAAAAVERAAGRPFGEFCREELFGPRGMTRTRWRDDFKAVIPGRAAAYAPRAGGWEIDLPYSDLVGNGGLLTTVGDLLRWTASFDGATGEWGAVVRRLETPARLNDGRMLTYALGLTVETRDGRTEIGHSGATAGFRTHLLRLPERGVAVAVLANAANFNATAVARSVARAVTRGGGAEGPDERAAPAGIAAPAEELRGRAGLYHSGQRDLLLAVEVREGRLRAGTTELAAQGAGRFAAAGGAAMYVFSGESLTVETANGTTHYERRARVRPTAEELAAYAGRYRSEELAVEGVLTVRDGRLILERWPHEPVTAAATFRDGFRFGPQWHGTFRRAADGRVEAVELTDASGRCRRIRFERR